MTPLGLDEHRLNPLVPTPPDSVVADPALGLDVHRLDPLVPTPPDSVAADPALGFDVPRLGSIVPTLLDGVVTESALGLDVHCLDPLVPTPPDDVAVDPALGVPMLLPNGIVADLAIDFDVPCLYVASLLQYLVLVYTEFHGRMLRIYLAHLVQAALESSSGILIQPEETVAKMELR
ncbi:hypothetical protein M885DRAFT_568715 [Pelagophyceae sp. CCMP2097]|nr:hypothetical protein M885DRAFT_568715 [Pelagophyceae sp. CCMP2097]